MKASSPCLKIKTHEHGKTIPLKLVEKFQSNMTDKIIQALQKIRGWSKEIIERYRIGYDHKFKQIMIPIFDDQGACLNIRRYSPKPPEGQGKILSYKKGYGSNRLFPVGILKKTPVDVPVVLCEGEPDALCGLSNGLICITQTAGAGSWSPDSNKAL